MNTKHRNGINLDHLNNVDACMQDDVARRIIQYLFGVECGIEYIELPGGYGLQYVNRGDTYDDTLCAGEEGWFWGSWGDEYETAQLNYEEESGERYCPCCGEYAPAESFTEEGQGSCCAEEPTR